MAKNEVFLPVTKITKKTKKIKKHILTYLWHKSCTIKSVSQLPPFLVIRKLAIKNFQQVYNQNSFFKPVSKPP